MGSKFWLLLLGLAVLAVCPCTSRAIDGAAAAAADESGDDADNDLSNNVETSTPTADEWVKMAQPPPKHVKHNLGSPLDLECEILGTPPPQVKWVTGAYNGNVSGRRGNSHSTSILTSCFSFFPFPSPTQADELTSNAIIEGSSGGVARVRSRLFLDHIPTVGEHKFTCVGQVGGQVVHATTVVKTSSSELFPSAIVNVRHRPVSSSPGNILSHLAFEAGSAGSATGPVVPRITKWFSVLLETIGNTVVLPCEAYAQPNPQIYWLDNNNEVISKRDPRFKVSYDGSLVIVNLKWDDMGEFHCVAKNDMGKDTKSTFIYPMLRD